MYLYIYIYVYIYILHTNISPIWSRYMWGIYFLDGFSGLAPIQKARGHEVVGEK